MEFSTEFGGFQKIHRFPSEFKRFWANPPNLGIICTSINALEDIINEESENEVQDTFHNALNIGEVGEDMYLLTKSLRFPSKHL